MKKRVGLGALLVLGGTVGVGAALILAAFITGTSVSATDIHALIVKTGPDPVWDGDTEICDDCEVVGNVYLHNCGATLQVVFTPTTPNMLDEVHACVAISSDFDWLPPGNRRKCEGLDALSYFGAAECDAGSCTIEIAANGDLGCWDWVFVQAHAAMEDRETAYGEEWKGGFWAEVTCCGC